MTRRELWELVNQEAGRLIEEGSQPHGMVDLDDLADRLDRMVRPFLAALDGELSIEEISLIRLVTGIKALLTIDEDLARREVREMLGGAFRQGLGGRV